MLLNSLFLLLRCMQVRGDLVTSGEFEERLNFFRMRKFVWTTAMGDPRAQNSTSSDKWEEKLHGEYLWPFSIKIPELPIAADDSDGQRFRLPHSFAERFSRASTEYYLELRINRGKFRSDDR